MIIHEKIGSIVSHPDGTQIPVESYRLYNGQGLAIEVWTYGATLVEVLVPDRHGRLDNVVVRLPDLGAYLDPVRNPYIGSTLGRYCRCVAQGRFSLDGHVYELDRNEGHHHFHGGSHGFDKKVWSAEVVEAEDGPAIFMRLESPDGDQGYPGALSATCRYLVTRDGQLVIDHTATTTASTVVGLTSHAFWNLAGKGLISGHELALSSSRVVMFDDELIPLRKPPQSMAGTELDFTRLRPIDSARLDHYYALDDNSALAAELHDPASGRRMVVTTDHPGLGVYSGDGLPHPRAGLCLQPSAWPDAPNRPDFPSVRLDPGSTYRQRTVFDFSVE
ncbi:aldose epimerase family protein [Streptomyces rochei]|uniref:aldose epimerase family protein n=1 Tax=Streptomyces rochei TaxID=1928 RepID=UPI00367520DE